MSCEVFAGEFDAYIGIIVPNRLSKVPSTCHFCMPVDVARSVYFMEASLDDFTLPKIDKKLKKIGARYGWQITTRDDAYINVVLYADIDETRDKFDVPDDVAIDEYWIEKKFKITTSYRDQDYDVPHVIFQNLGIPPLSKQGWGKINKLVSEVDAFNNFEAVVFTFDHYITEGVNRIEYKLEVWHVYNSMA